MFSLPFITPRPDASLWPSHRISNTLFDTPAIDSQNAHLASPHRRPTSRHGHHAASRSVLATLQNDENQVNKRKENIRRFGAGWIRPPGIAKTYQAIMDEAAEREEQEMQARRDQALLDLAAAQTEAANQQEAGEHDEEMVEGERDLDEEVPEAEADESDLSGEEPETSMVEEEVTGVDSTTGDLTFNEESFIEGSLIASQVEQLLDVEEAEATNALAERDLDDDIPEAGSYEHTETDLSADSMSSELGSMRRGTASSAARRAAHRRSSGPQSASASARARRSQRSTLSEEEISSILEGSSFLHSSPVAGRGATRARFAGGRGRAG